MILRVDEQQYELDRMTRFLETKEERILQLKGKKITSDHKDLDEKVNAMARQIHIELNEQYIGKGCIRINVINVPPKPYYVSAALLFLQHKLNITFILMIWWRFIRCQMPRRTSSNKNSPSPKFVKFVR